MERSNPYLISESMPELLPMDRTPGVHVSTCISRICIRSHHFFTPSGGLIDQARLELGTSWEYGLKERLYQNYKNRYCDLGEIEHEGIFGTPDLLDSNPLSELNICLWMGLEGIKSIQGGKIIDEVKCTWMSSKQDPMGAKFWKYWCQIMCYCAMLGLNTGRLRIVYVNGDYSYRGGSPVKYHDWIRQFSQWELISTWQRIKKESEAMEKEARDRGFESVADEMIQRGKEDDLYR